MFVVVLPAAYQAPWQAKPLQQWDAEDARKLLAESPWAKNVQLDRVRNLSKFERRDGGNMEAGIGRTVEFTDFFTFWRDWEAREQAETRSRLGKVVVRWESALPVQAAKMKVGDTRAPSWSGDYYAIAVFDLPRPFRWRLASDLRGVAFLKREGKKDLKPARVLVAEEADGLGTYVYLFPKIEITKKDRSLGFAAQIGRLWVEEYFYPEQMQIGGELQL
jgi:hypothetical protein